MDPLSLLANSACVVMYAVQVGQTVQSHKDNCARLVDRLKKLHVLLEDLQKVPIAETKSTTGILESLEKALRKAKDLLERCCKPTNRVYMVVRAVLVSNQFQDVTSEIDRCINAIPLICLRVSHKISQQVSDISTELRRVRYGVDLQSQRLQSEIELLVREQREGLRASHAAVARLAQQLQLYSGDAIAREGQAIEAERAAARAEKDRLEEDYLTQIIALLGEMSAEVAGSSPQARAAAAASASVGGRAGEREDGGREEGALLPGDGRGREMATTGGGSGARERRAGSTSPPGAARKSSLPAEFICPLSLEIMADPVIVSSGQTYERAYIEAWLKQQQGQGPAGPLTCPTTRRPLAHTALIPNFAVKASITSWCVANGLPFPEPRKLELIEAGMRQASPRAALDGDGKAAASDKTWRELELEQHAAAAAQAAATAAAATLSPPPKKKDPAAAPLAPPPRLASNKPAAAMAKVESNAEVPNPAAAVKSSRLQQQEQRQQQQQQQDLEQQKQHYIAVKRVPLHRAESRRSRRAAAPLPGAGAAQAAPPAPAPKRGPLPPALTIPLPSWNGIGLDDGEDGDCGDYASTPGSCRSSTPAAPSPATTAAAGPGPGPGAAGAAAAAATGAGAAAAAGAPRAHWSSSRLTRLVVEVPPPPSEPLAALARSPGASPLAGGTPSTSGSAWTTPGTATTDGSRGGARGGGHSPLSGTSASTSSSEFARDEETAPPVQAPAYPAPVHAAPAPAPAPTAKPAFTARGSSPSSSGVLMSLPPGKLATPSPLATAAVGSPRAPSNTATPSPGAAKEAAVPGGSSGSGRKRLPALGRVHSESPRSQRSGGDDSNSQTDGEVSSSSSPIWSQEIIPGGKHGVERRASDRHLPLRAAALAAASSAGLPPGHRATQSVSSVGSAGSFGSEGGRERRAVIVDTDLTLRLLEDLRVGGAAEAQVAAALEVRQLAKGNEENRVRLGQAGVVERLVALVDPDAHADAAAAGPEVAEGALYALLNLSINDANKRRIVALGAVASLVEALFAGAPGVKGAAAALLFSLSVMDDHKIVIGAAGGVPPLLELLLRGAPSLEAKQDAIRALYNLSLYAGNREALLAADAVRPLVNVLNTESCAVLQERAVAILALLASLPEGWAAIERGRGIPALAAIVDVGSQKGKEDAAAALLLMSTHSPACRARIMDEDVVASLMMLTQSGTPRAKAKAKALLRQFNEPR